MQLSQEEVNSLINGLEQDFRKAWSNKDAAALAQMYHPQAAFVITGVNCDFGREAIQKSLESFLSSSPPPFELHAELCAEAAKGEYLITRGYYVTADGTKKPYEQIFKRNAEGKYLIYHDEFSV
ncbi:hypothetical protein DdX_14983 [Ditylenchus destructor]|uniref:DUF4440 domain-containing protein n=1 Tax=Ditylenchus destructor TaxID=166010 RepID=A0AAD4R1F4_9BILA|nr:hypothetical protein DdX_14983 [Ditylenchus destructor]